MVELPYAQRINRSLVGGVLIERASPLRCPAHAATYASLCGIFGRWAATHARRRWEMFGFGYPFRLSRNPDTVLGFDFAICTYEMVHSQPRDLHFVEGAPALAVEVIDLDDSPEQFAETVEMALAAGAGSFWVVDPFEETVKVYQPNARPVDFRPGQSLTEKEALPGFRCLVDSIFE